MVIIVNLGLVIVVLVMQICILGELDYYLIR